MNPLARPNISQGYITQVASRALIFLWNSEFGGNSRDILLNSNN